MATENKEKIPEWFVIKENPNSKKFEKYNIFNHVTFLEECDEIFKECKYLADGFSKFEKRVKDKLMYYFWGKREWEIMILNVGYENSKNITQQKLDVFEQIILNWDRFIEHLWEYYVWK